MTANIPARFVSDSNLSGIYNRLMHNLNNRTVDRNVQLVGVCLKQIIRKPMTEEAVQESLYIVDSLKNKKPEYKDSTHIINIIYSTIIKRIDAVSLIKKLIKPETYIKLIQDSIEMYREHPINSGIDYRHVLGRIITLKAICQKVYNSYIARHGGFRTLFWNDERQLDLLTVQEKVVNDFENVKKNYTKANGKYAVDRNPNGMSFDKTREAYYENIMTYLYLNLLCVKSLMKHPFKNKEIIQDKLDIAYEYFDKVPYEHPNIESFFNYFRQLKEQDKLLQKLTATKKR